MTHPVSETGTESDALMIGSTIGRYEILERLGSGGMGVVFSARDPELDREVAIKLLYPTQAPPGRRQQQLRREAQALARLNHPNVVTLLHIGEHRRQLYVVMERVDGQTLDAWLESGSRSLPEILGVLYQAGQGLAASHAAGLVHCDVKPSNIMISPVAAGDSGVGRVRVMDFGLARLAVDDETEAEGEALLRPSPRGSRPGSALRGTPAYMAPEQFDDAPAEPATDQFGFCVTAYEALMGTRPFPGETALERALAADGPPPPFLHRTGLSSRISSAIMRGLERDPADRWPTMQALLEQFEPTNWRRRRVLWGGLGGCAVLLAAMLLSSPDPPCPRPEAVATWPVRRGEIVNAFAESGLTDPAVVDRTLSRLDAYRSDWMRRNAELCRAASQSADTLADLDERRVCLDAALSRWSTVADVLARDDRAALAAGNALALLPELRQCDTPTNRLVSGGLDLTDPKQIELHSELAAVETELVVGAYDTARRRILRLRDDAALPPDTRFTARLDVLEGRLESTVGNHAKARALLERGYFAAMAAEDRRLALSANLHLIAVYGLDLHDPEQARRWASFARSLVEVLDDPILEAELDLELADVARGEGDYVGAAEGCRRGLDLAATRDVPNRTVWGLHATLGSSLAAMGQLEEAIVHLQRAYDLRALDYGEGNPALSFQLHNLANVKAQAGDVEAALELYDEVIRMREKAYGPSSPRVADVLANKGVTYLKMTKTEDAVASLQRAYEIYRESGADEFELAHIQGLLGFALTNLGRTTEARRLVLEAIRGYEEARGADHPSLVEVHGYMVLIDLREQNYSDALRHSERALEIAEQAPGLPTPTLRRAFGRHARVLAELDRCEDAQVLFATSDLDRNATPTQCPNLRTARERCPSIEVPGWCTDPH
jgi:serine/threonine protein kinase/tetratricopeptide (TPR) repeat protein